jgi:CheY-like chemotaxis protein
VATILLVEDDPDIRETLTEILHGECYTVLTAGHGREGLSVLLSLPELPDVILLDLRMPVMDGRELRRCLRSHPEWHRIPVVIYSGTPDFCPSDDLEPLAGHLVKPVEIPVLLAILRRCSPPGSGSGCVQAAVEDSEADDLELVAA